MEKRAFITDKLLERIKERPENSHKGTFGTMLSLTGSTSMPGAACLSSMAALRSGVGLLKVASDESTVGVLKNNIYEAVFVDANDILTTECSSFLVGCGIGRHYDDVLGDILLGIKADTVIDADGINYLALHINETNILKNMQCAKIITPHPGEMSRLTGLSVEEIEAGRAEVAVSFAEIHDCVVVLKGHETVVAFPNGKYCVNTSGNSGLAKGGSGDVLAGLICGLLAQGYSCYEAAMFGVYIHGLAADRLVSMYGKHGMLPSDLCFEIGRILG